MEKRKNKQKEKERAARSPKGLFEEELLSESPPAHEPEHEWTKTLYELIESTVRLVSRTQSRKHSKSDSMEALDSLLLSGATNAVRVRVIAEAWTHLRTATNVAGFCPSIKSVAEFVSRIDSLDTWVRQASPSLVDDLTKLYRQEAFERRRARARKSQVTFIVDELEEYYRRREEHEKNA